MATILWKDGKSQRFEARKVSTLLKNGWFTTKGSSLEETKPSIEDADLNDSGKLNPTEVRVAAKKAGLENWQTARIATLKKELGYA